MSASVRVQLLGPVRAFNGGAEVALRGKTARTVLARLALSAGSVVSVDQLIDALWSDDPPLEPAVSLRSIISRLRSRIGRNTIVTDGSGYRLDVNAVEIDLTEIEEAVKSLDTRDVEPDELATKLDMWNGGALSDVAWTSVFEPERVRIEELRARLTDGYHQALLQHGRASEALPDLERTAAAAPLRESTQLLLMRSLHACGRTADALRAGSDYRRRAVDQTGIDPSAAYDTLVQALLSDEGPHPRDAPRLDDRRPRSASRWIPPDTPFVGRDRERAELDAAVQQHRLITIVGPGGVGKTRLVTEYLNDIDHDAVHMVALATLPRSATVDVAVATAVGLETSSVDARGALVDRLAGQRRLLVLDNCEHVLASARLLVEHLLQFLAEVQIITTSRTRLGLSGESQIAVGPLDLSAEDLNASAPVELFLDRVARSSMRGALDNVDVSVVADVCRLLDGLPLGLELAAARVPMLGIDGLRQRLIDGLAVPGSHVADDDRRQATIESTVEWSRALLGDDARHVFDELSVFPSWFDLAAVEHVSTLDDVIGPLGEIVDSSLVVVDPTRPVYRLLQPVRQVARRNLSNGRRDAITDQYLDFTTELIRRIDDHWRADRRLDAHQLVIAHRHDLRTALTHLADRGNAEAHGRYALILTRALTDRADSELIELCNLEVGASVDGELARCILAWHQGDPDTSVAIGEQLAATVDDATPQWPVVHWALACAHLYRGDAEEVARCADIAVHHAQSDQFTESESVALWALAALYQDRPDEAVAIIANHEYIVQRSTNAFVTYARAEIAAVADPDAAMDLLAAAARESVATGSTFTHRVVEVSQCALLIRIGRQEAALEVACRLVPELLRVGTQPQAWTTLRHIAEVLGPFGEPDLGLLILDSADADESAPSVVGDAAQAEAELRATLTEHSENAAPEPMSLGSVWEMVEPVLRSHALADRGPDPPIRSETVR